MNEVFTFTDPARIGVIEFKTKKGKTSFFTEMKNKTVKLGDSKTMTWTNDDTLETRIKNKRLGYIKYHLHEKLKIDLKDITIKRQSNVVNIKRKTVAKAGADGELILIDEAFQVKKDVDDSMKRYSAKFDGAE